MTRHPAPAARRSRSYLRFAVGWGKASGREGVSFGFPVLGHPRDLGGRREPRRVCVHLREFFLVHRLPLCPVGPDFRVRLLLGLPQPRCLLCCGRGEMEGGVRFSARRERGRRGADAGVERVGSYPDERRSRLPVPPARRRGASGFRPEIPWLRVRR